LEDEPIVADDLQYQAAQLGYEVVGIVDSGPEAIAVTDETSPEIAAASSQISDATAPNEKTDIGLSSPEREVAHRPRVLICEDSVLIQESLRAVLEPTYDVVACVDDGLVAIEAIAAERPDVVLLDISLPGANGFVITEKVLAANPHIKAIFVTSYAEKAYVTRAFELGASGYVLKGCAVTELLTAIQTAMAGGKFRSALLR
jgi:DNA-binding NarL/FixJ family response regulator